MENISKIVKKVEGGYKVKQATKKGYEIANEGDCVDLSYPTSKTWKIVYKQHASTA
jgi:hypothetical protein